VTRPPNAPFRVCVALVAALACARAIGAEPESVVSLLEALRARGVDVIYSSDLVPPELPASAAVPGIEPMARVRGVLASHGLMLREIGPSRYIVTLAPAESVSSPEPASPALPVAVPEPQEVSVYASRYDLGSDALGEPRLLGKTHIEQVPGSQDDALRATRVIPGIVSNLSTRPYIRGSSVDDVLVLFDGVPLADPFHFKNFQSLVSAFDPAAVQHIEVYSSGYPVSYGTRSGGVINIEPRSLRSGREHALGASLLAYDASTVGHSDSWPIDWLATVRHSVSDMVLKPVSWQDGEPEFLDTLGRVRWKQGDTGAWTLGWLLLDDGIELASGAADKSTNARSSDEYVWLAREDNWRDGFSSRTVLSGASGERQRSARLDDPLVGFASLDEQRYFSSTAFSSLWSYRRDRRITWTFGAEAAHTSADLRYTRTGRFSDAIASSFGRPADNTLVASAMPAMLSYAGFVSARRRWKQMEMEFGVRLDGERYDGERSRKEISPRLNARYDVADGWRLYGSWGRFTQAQRVDEWRLEDPQTTPDPTAIAVHTVLGVVYEPDDTFRASFELYGKRWTQVRPYYDNLLDTLSLVPDLAPDRVRVAPLASEAAGAELTVRRSLSRGIDVWGSYSTSHVADHFASRKDVRRSWDQPHALSLGLDWTGTSWKASAVLGWHRGWPRTDVAWNENNAGTLRVGARNASRWGNYFTTDLSATHTRSLFDGELSTWVEVTNAMDRRNDCCAHLVASASPDVSSAVERSSWLPRIVNVGMTWRFGNRP
jgi:hypothetical protein